MKVLITGASGSGTSTLGKEIATAREWLWLDADDFYWLPSDPPYQQVRDRQTRHDMLLASMDVGGNCVVSGSVMGWGDALEAAFDAVVFLYLETPIRIERLRAREMAELGFVDPEFIEWASQYDEGPPTGRSLSKHRSWLESREVPVLRLEGDESVAHRSEQVDQFLAALPVRR